MEVVDKEMPWVPGSGMAMVVGDGKRTRKSDEELEMDGQHGQ